MIDKEQVWKALEMVMDPELGVDIVNLGLVYGVDVEGTKVTVTMTLTSIGCPEAGLIQDAVDMAVSSVAGVEDVEIDWTFDPPWSPNKVSEEGMDILQSLGYL
jgi:metal-sulfur cluster biosynthetic enzyme